MRRARQPRFSVAASWMLVGSCAFAASCGAEDDPGPGLAVAASWQQARDVVGHRVHVVDEKIACARCHDLSGERIDVPKPAVCVTCHDKEALIAHDRADAQAVHGRDSPVQCGDCHAFVPSDGGATLDAWDCMRCHAEAQNDLPAVVIHAQSTCDTCHRPHEVPQAAPSDCRKCHDDVSTTHFVETADGRNRSFGEVCSTCHQDQHAPAQRAGEHCAPCHAATEPIVEATAIFEGHDRCIACHRPHDAAIDDAVACRSCHESTPVLGGGVIPQHADCKNCHDPHAPTAGITKACVSCHAEQHTDHPAAFGGEACSTCHSPHPAAGAGKVARTCSNCHHAAADDRDFHGAETRCSDCHQRHQFSASSGDMTLCASCHQGPVAATRAVPEHGRCADCHSGLPHRPLEGSSQCGRCHSTQLAKSVVEHRNCRACHEPHGGGVIATCGSCHGEQQKWAPAGHRACSSCHDDAHTGTVGKACTTCHADKTNASHATVNGGCESCHSAHDEKGVTFSPSCVSCHAPAHLPGLHAKKNHQTCTQCHQDTHDTALPTNQRKLCGTCHQGLEKHEPDAPRCVSCHLFE